MTNRKLRRVPGYVFLSLAAVASVFPLYFMLVSATNTSQDVLGSRLLPGGNLIANFTNSELQRHGMDVEGLLANPNVRKFVDWVANKDPDFTATTAKKQR